MQPTLYFLRSSEEKIAINMAKHAHPNDTQDISIYCDSYGLTAKDLGLYVLVEQKIAGAIWTRELNKTHNASAFIDEQTPVLSMSVLEDFRGKGIGSFMMEQFLQEAGATYKQICVCTHNNQRVVKFYEKFGFVRADESQNHTMIKKLETKEVVRPSDGYDPTRWMD